MSRSGMPEISVNMNIGDRQLTMIFDPDLPVHNSILANLQNMGAYEPGTQFFFMRVLRKGDVFFDVGAHVGYFTMIAAAMVGDSGKVVSVEPIEENFRMLSRNIEVNNLPYVHAVRSVISGTDGDIEFHHNLDNDGGHALWKPSLHPENKRSRDTPKAEILPSMTMRALLEKFECDHIRAMKIDTEGAEKMILESGEDFFRGGGADFIVAEVNATGLGLLGSSVDDFFTFARSLGFVVLLPNEDGSAPTVMTNDSRPDPKYVYNVILARPTALADL